MNTAWMNKNTYSVQGFGSAIDKSAHGPMGHPQDGIVWTQRPAGPFRLVFDGLCSCGATGVRIQYAGARR